MKFVNTLKHAGNDFRIFGLIGIDTLFDLKLSAIIESMITNANSEKKAGGYFPKNF